MQKDFNYFTIVYASCRFYLILTMYLDHQWCQVFHLEQMSDVVLEVRSPLGPWPPG